MTEFCTIAQLSAAFDARSVSPVEITIDLLQRIDALDPVLHAFIQVTPELALHEAKQAEARLMAGRRIGPLDGVPIAHKDNFDTAGITTTANSARIAALHQRLALTRRMAEACRDVDVLLLPAQDGEAERVEDVAGALPFEKSTLTIPFCVTGAPAIVIPAARGGHGMPVGLQLAACGELGAMLRAACALERALGHNNPPPPPMFAAARERS